jgi:hypothetical protein
MSNLIRFLFDNGLISPRFLMDFIKEINYDDNPIGFFFVKNENKKMGKKNIKILKTNFHTCYCMSEVIFIVEKFLSRVRL